VDTDGRGLVLEPHPASIQDRDGGGPLLRVSRYIFPFIQRVFAHSGYAGEKVTTATLIAVEIVRKNPDQVGFAVNPALGRRAVLRLDRAQSTAGKRLRSYHRFRTRLPLRRIRHAALAKFPSSDESNHARVVLPAIKHLAFEATTPMRIMLPLISPAPELGKHITAIWKAT
jgi:hypothetical protein